MHFPLGARPPRPANTHGAPVHAVHLHVQAAAVRDFLVMVALCNALCNAICNALCNALCKAAALRDFLVMVAAGVAGNSTHMMSAAVLALARLIYAYRGRESMLETSVQLLQTICSLLQHKAQEVVRAAITFCKVALSALPLSRVQPLLPNLVPPLLTWCSNKHPHLKTQAPAPLVRQSRLAALCCRPPGPSPHALEGCGPV